MAVEVNITNSGQPVQAQQTGTRSDGQKVIVDKGIAPFVIAAEPFGPSDGKSFTYPLRVAGAVASKVNRVNAIYRYDWQGRQKLYLYPRTNIVYPRTGRAVRQKPGRQAGHADAKDAQLAEGYDAGRHDCARCWRARAKACCVV